MNHYEVSTRYNATDVTPYTLEYNLSLSHSLLSLRHQSHERGRDHLQIRTSSRVAALRRTKLLQARANIDSESLTNQTRIVLTIIYTELYNIKRNIRS